MAENCVNMNTDCVQVRLIEEPKPKGKGLFALKNFNEGDVIFREWPLVFCQFPWNETCKYQACNYCLRPLETAEENVRRLSNQPNFSLPYPECSTIDKSKHMQCEECGVSYCCAECKQLAYNKYHKTLCLLSKEQNSNHPLIQLNDTWKEMNYPPETTGIMLFARIFAMVIQANEKEKHIILQQFSEFCRMPVSGDEEMAHKLLGEHFLVRLEVLRDLMGNIFQSPETNHWLTPQGFRSLFTMVGINGQGIGSSSLAEWAHKVQDLKSTLPAEEQDSISTCLDNLYDVVERESEGFLNCEGSGLYTLQSKINHSCTPNAESCFLDGNARVAIRAVKPIAAGEEITISYLTTETERSRHSRQKYLRANYLFNCECDKCLSQADDPDITSESEMSDDESGKEEIEEGDH